METVFRLLVLVPHRDARLPLRAWGDSLFAAELLTGWSFPGVAPLALLKRALSGEELRSLAHLLRGEERERKGLVWGHEGTGEIGVWEIDGERMSVWGPKLNIEISDDFLGPVAGAIERSISPPVIGTALMQGPVPGNLPAPPQVSFRAAALANMECRFLPSETLGWGIGPLQWLPKRAS